MIEPIPAIVGTRPYSTIPRTKNAANVVLRPMTSEIEAQKKRPAMLKIDNTPTKPAAAAAVVPTISCAMGEACSSRAIPAVAFKNNTSHSR